MARMNFTTKDVHSQWSWQYLRELEKISECFPIRYIPARDNRVQCSDFNDQHWIVSLLEDYYPRDTNRLLYHLWRGGRVRRFRHRYNLVHLNIVDDLVVLYQGAQYFALLEDQYDDLAAEIRDTGNKNISIAKRYLQLPNPETERLSSAQHKLENCYRSIAEQSRAALNAIYKVAVSLLKTAYLLTGDRDDASLQLLEPFLTPFVYPTELGYLTKAATLRSHLLPSRIMRPHSFLEKAHSLIAEYNEKVTTSQKNGSQLYADYLTIVQNLNLAIAATF